MRITIIRITEWLFVAFILGLMALQTFHFEPEAVKTLAEYAKNLLMD